MHSLRVMEMADNEKNCVALRYDKNREKRGKYNVVLVVLGRVKIVILGRAKATNPGRMKIANQSNQTSYDLRFIRFAICDSHWLKCFGRPFATVPRANRKINALQRSVIRLIGFIKLPKLSATSLLHSRH